jgi:glycosyltransferase involved in cell wall biosynthesis
MHICFITSEFPKTGFPHGGVGIFVATLGKALVEKGIQVSVIGLNYTDEEITENINDIDVYRLPRKKFEGLTWLYNSNAIAKKIKEVHQKVPINFVETAELGLAFLSKIKEIKYVIRLHGGHHFLTEKGKRHNWKVLQEKLSFKKADAFVAVSNYVKEGTNEFLSYHNKPIEVIPNPVETKIFQPAISQFEKYNIVFVGTVYPKKGLENLIEAFKHVVKKYPKAHLNIYGREWFFPNKTSYTNLLKSKCNNDLLESITFHGAVNHNKLPQIYQAAHVCVFPSFVESQGIVVIEAMATEKVVAFSNIPIGCETIVPFETGLLVDPLDAKDIAEKILWVFEHDKESKQIGINARKYVMKTYDIDVILNKNIQFYTKI